jgi:pimeloyl-ACP methyl ester carboxylesterase
LDNAFAACEEPGAADLPRADPGGGRPAAAHVVEILAGEVTVPTHIAVGGRSPSELHHVARALADAVPGATLTTVPKQDHMVAAKIVLQILRERFFGECRQGAL